MVWFRNVTMTNLIVMSTARTRIRIQRAAPGTEDARVLYWSACYGLAVAATTLQAFNSVKREEGDKRADDTCEPSYEAVLKLPLGL